MNVFYLFCVCQIHESEFNFVCFFRISVDGRRICTRYGTISERRQIHPIQHMLQKSSGLLDIFGVHRPHVALVLRTDRPDAFLLRNRVVVIERGSNFHMHVAETAASTRLRKMSSPSEQTIDETQIVGGFGRPRENILPQSHVVFHVLRHHTLRHPTAASHRARRRLFDPTRVGASPRRDVERHHHPRQPNY